MPQNQGRNPNLRILGLSKGFVGIQEIGNNVGPEIEEIQKAIFGIADSQAYCMAFIHFIIGKVEKEFEIKSTIHVSGSVLQTWLNSMTLKVDVPEPGDVVLWQTGEWSGHAGIFRKHRSIEIFETIEANTSSGSQGSQREGDGIYPRVRTFRGGRKFELKGFLRVFPWKG